MNVICEAVEMRPRDLFMGLRGSIGGLPGGPRGSRGHPTDPMGPSGWFDESSDDSLGIYACIYVIQIFIAD